MLSNSSDDYRRPQAAELARRLVESAVGAHVANAAAAGECELFYWRERHREVDFVARAGRRVIAIEVKSRRARHVQPGAATFADAFKPERTLLVRQKDGRQPGRPWPSHRRHKHRF
jgi:predicted AAA+ superfamily ATPase